MFSLKFGVSTHNEFTPVIRGFSFSLVIYVTSVVFVRIHPQEPYRLKTVMF